MTCAHLNAAFRRWTFSHSRAVFAGNGKLGALRRILADIPCYFLGGVTMLDPVGSKLKRASNRKASAEILTNAGVQFTSHNDGAHLVVVGSLPKSLIDFWPGTGKWIPRMESAENRRRVMEYRGVRRLLAAIRDRKF